MEKYILRILFISFILPLFLVSCVNPEPFFLVLRGNNDFKKGDYQNANVEYLRAAKHEDYTSWISFNLGTVYNALGENDAAQEEWETAAEEDNSRLRFLSKFNLGTIYYKKGWYEEAYTAFQESLIISPNNIPAKVNLEHTMAKMIAKGREQDTKSAVSSGKERVSDEIERVLEYVQRKEEHIWKTPETVSSGKEALDW